MGVLGVSTAYVPRIDVVRFRVRLIMNAVVL